MQTASLRPPPITQSGELIIDLKSGLGNRLCALLSAWVIADAEGVPVRFRWSKSVREGIPCAAEDLFDCSRAPLIESVAEDDDSEENIPSLASLPVGFGTRVRAGETIHGRSWSLLTYHGMPDWEFFNRLRERFALLPPSPAVRELMDVPHGDYVGIHVRYTDHFPSYVTTPRWLYRWLVETILETLPGQKIWICGDTPDFIRELQSMAPSRIAISACAESGSAPDRNTPAGIQLAFAELVTLARARVIFGAPFSTFAQFAMYLSGGRNFHVTFHPMMNRSFISRALWTLYHGRRGDSKLDGPFKGRLVRALTSPLTHPAVQSLPWLVSRERLAAQITETLTQAFPGQSRFARAL